MRRMTLNYFYATVKNQPIQGNVPKWCRAVAAEPGPFTDHVRDLFGGRDLANEEHTFSVWSALAHEFCGGDR